MWTTPPVLRQLRGEGEGRGEILNPILCTLVGRGRGGGRFVVLQPASLLAEDAEGARERERKGAVGNVKHLGIPVYQPVTGVRKQSC